MAEYRSRAATPRHHNSNDRSRSQLLTKTLTELVPGGAHTHAKGADQYPEGMAPVISHGRGAHVWDVDGNVESRCRCAEDFVTTKATLSFGLAGCL